MRPASPLVLLLVLASLAPLASAQAPDPAEVVAQACALAGDAGDLVPLCPREEPAAPQQAQEPAAEQAHDHGAQDAPQAAQDLAGEAQDAAGDVADDPASAPDRLAGLVASILQFLRDLLGLPVAGFTLAVDAMSAVGSALATAASTAASAVATGAQAVASAVADGASYVGDLAAQGVQALASLFAADAPASVDGGLVDAPAAKAPVDQATGLLQQVVGALPSA